MKKSQIIISTLEKYIIDPSLLKRSKKIINEEHKDVLSKNECKIVQLIYDALCDGDKTLIMLRLERIHHYYGIDISYLINMYRL